MEPKGRVRESTAREAARLSGPARDSLPGIPPLAPAPRAIAASGTRRPVSAARLLRRAGSPRPAPAPPGLRVPCARAAGAAHGRPPRSPRPGAPGRAQRRGPSVPGHRARPALTLRRRAAARGAGEQGPRVLGERRPEPQSSGRRAGPRPSSWRQTQQRPPWGPPKQSAWKRGCALLYTWRGTLTPVTSN